MTAQRSVLAALADPLLFQTQSFIGGQWVSDSHRFSVMDPATGLVLAEVANLGAAQAELAVQAACQAGPQWRAQTAKQRSACLMNWFHLIQQHASDLALIMTAEQGKPLAESRAEVAYGASFVEWFAEEAKRVYGQTIPSTDPNKRSLVLKQPVGVCAAITPWNFPIAMITRKVAPALAAGCTVVIKPAEQTPLCALALAELARRAGLPAGVLNVVTADSERSVEVGRVLCASPQVRHLSFTGSTEVGRVLAAQCAPTVKKLSLELGGNAAFIVFEDAHLASAVEGAVAAKYRNAGQTCVCVNRFYVHSSLYDAFVSQLAAKVQALKVGHGLEPDVAQGPLIDAAAMSKVQRHVADALSKGAVLVAGGQKIGEYFYAPTVLAHVTHDMQCASEETFGPVAAVFKFNTEDEAVEMANHTEFGLAGYVYSRDMGRIWRVCEALECGMVGVNTGLISSAEVPFGGIKQSGFGREGSGHGMDDYLELKYVCWADVLK
jgi:succinate-semialdehyde dehydrogenase / glutarate-semialdehyde dehydrogenase